MIMNTKQEEIGIKEKPWNPFEVLLKMRREAPEFRRCCFCLPVRRGLISWGYIKLSLNVAVSALLMYFLIVVRMFLPPLITALVFLNIDAAFNVLLIVGSHMKNVKFMKIAYVHNMVWLGVLFLVLFWYIYLYIELKKAMGLSVDIDVHFLIFIIVPGLCTNFTIMFVQIYFILLIRSDVLKLEKQSLEMQFTKPLAAEAQCTMHVAFDADSHVSDANRSIDSYRRIDVSESEGSSSNYA